MMKSLVQKKLKSMMVSGLKKTPVDYSQQVNT